MIATGFVTIPTNEEDGLMVGRAVEIKAATQGDLLNDVKALANGLKEKAMHEAKESGRTFTEADRIRLENAFCEGLRMTAEEVKEMDAKTFERMAEEALDEIKADEARKRS